MKQETVITKRVTWYVSINGRGNNNQLVDTYRRLEEVAHAKNKGRTGGYICGRSERRSSGRSGGNIGRGKHSMVRR